MTKLISILGLSLLLGPMVRAQSSPASLGPIPFGSGEEPLLNFHGLETPQNLVLFSVSEETVYDDNIFSNNSNRHADESMGLSPRFAILQDRHQLKLALDYQPTFILYRKYSGYDAANQALQFDGEVDPSSRVFLRLRDSVHYMTGIFQPAAGEAVVPALGAPSSLNESVYAPLTRELENASRLDLGFRMSKRAAITFFGGALERNFGHTSNFGGTLFNTNEENAGAEFSDRVSKSTTLGAVYLFQNLAFGSESRDVIHTLYFTLAQGFMSGLNLQLFAGPQFSRIRDHVVESFSGLTLTTNTATNKIYPTFGGALSGHLRKTTFSVSGERSVSDGGGLLTAVTYYDGNAELRRKLTRRWDGMVDFDVARSQSVGTLLAGTKLDSQMAGVAVEHTFSAGLTARLSYNFLRQRSTGAVLFLPDLDRNRVSLTVFYQFRKAAM